MAELDSLNIQKALDNCICNDSSDYSIGKLSYIILKRAGYYYEPSEVKRGIWKNSEGKHEPKIKNIMRNMVIDELLSRSTNTNDPDSLYKSNKILNICLKFSRDNFINKIINEAKIFYC